jgi:hypothetical protein
VPYRQLPWEIIDEMTLRHPGYVAYVVPYDGIGHHKATLFFGLPVQNYYYKAMNDNQATALNNQSRFGAGAQDFFNGATWNNGLLRSKLENNIQASRMKPFRQYFYIDSEHHLIDNGIITSARDTFNAVEIAYVKDARSAMPNRAPDPSNFYTTDTVKVKCNEAIREDFCRYFSTRERNCEGDWFAERYAYSYLFRCLKDLYQGEIVITGEPSSMKPYDQIFLFDSYNDMAGPIEVEQVTHIFSQETGFVCRIWTGTSSIKTA